MDPILQFIKDYSLISGIIATTSASIGWVFRNLFEIFIENKKYKRELKTYFWKEKINASKKASEFYLEYSNFLNLARLQFESFRLGKIEHKSLIENFQKEVSFYVEKLKSFPHFEHHHINLFYEFDEDKTIIITNKINATNREILELNSESENTEKTKHLFKVLEDSYTQLFDLQKGYVKRVREDLKNQL